MRNAFIIKEARTNIHSHDSIFSYHGGGYGYNCMSAPLSITLELYPCGSTEEDILSSISSIIHAGKEITISDYNAYVDPFKEEFKQFLLERYPEKIMKNQQGFKQLFGEL